MPACDVCHLYVYAQPALARLIVSVCIHADVSALHLVSHWQ